MAKILDISNSKTGITLKEQPKRPYCAHDQLLLLDTHHRIIECANCGQVIDPFDYLNKKAVKTNRTLDYKLQLEKEAKEASVRLAELLKQERNAKARLRTLNSKLSK